MSEQTTHSVVRDLLPTAPSVGVAGASYLGMSLSDWVLFATLIYTAVQLVIALPKAIAVIKGWLRK